MKTSLSIAVAAALTAGATTGATPSDVDQLVAAERAFSTHSVEHGAPKSGALKSSDSPSSAFVCSDNS